MRVEHGDSLQFKRGRSVAGSREVCSIQEAGSLCFFPHLADPQTYRHIY